MKEYLTLLKKIIKNGKEKIDRTKIGTRSIFGHQMRFNLKKGFPLITTKKCSWKCIVYELLWFLSGNTNISFLKKNNVNIWNNWADKDGNLGPIYGKQWRSWNTTNGNKIDQIKIILDQLKNEKNSRRIIVSSWNVEDLNKMSIPPCHVLFQFYVINNKLSCQLYQRSCDVFLGLPFNIASYSLLIHIIAKECNFEVGEFIWTGGDIHIYNNHFDQVNIQLNRIPKKLPIIFIKNKKSIFDYSYEDFKLKNYNYYPPIKAPIAI